MMHRAALLLLALPHTLSFVARRGGGLRGAGGDVKVGASRRSILETSTGLVFGAQLAPAYAADVAERPATAIDPTVSMPEVTARCYLDMSIDGTNAGRIVIGLFGKAVPRVSENFRRLCEKGYAGSEIYRVISDFTIQGGSIGDVTGRTGKAAEGDPFEPDNFDIVHNTKGLVSMVRGVGGKVDSRFFITLKDDAGWADGRYAAFGIVEEGFGVVQAIEKLDVTQPQNKPKKKVLIVASGLL